ncbi:MAG: hypothetical protein EOP47_12225 [Sphingobacteriaceae bacterium]|nr:MAG: hypothetical protein EOP47_12225 [Sphingobacteriaceae bacterium]
MKKILKINAMKYILFVTLVLNIHFSFAQNVGIGTTTPTAKLQVNGTLKIVNGSQGEGKVLTSDAAGLATWKVPEKSIFKATGFVQAVTVAPSVGIILKDWKTVEINVGANSIFVNAQGDFFVLKDGLYKVSAKVTANFDDPGDSHYIGLTIMVNGIERSTSTCPVPTNDNALDINHQRVGNFVTSVFQLSAQDKINFRFSNAAFLSNTSAVIPADNKHSEFIVELL